MIQTPLLAGVDEAGLGSLFGDAVVCCLVLPDSFPDNTYLQIRDSKKLSPKKREVLCEYIKKNCITYGIGITSYSEIDEYNILQAKLKAMSRASYDAYSKYHFNNIIRIL